MWYAVQVLAGEEEKMAEKCKKALALQKTGDGMPQNSRNCFIPYYLRMRRYCGKWHVEKKVLFPGYLFLAGEEPEEWRPKLELLSGVSGLLGTGRDAVPLEEEEEWFLKKMGGQEHVVGLSVGNIEQGRLIVTSGPLRGMERYVRKIDRHKRLAWLEMPMLGESRRAQVGLEVVAKT